MTEQEKKRATERLIYLVQKRYGNIKAKTVVNGGTQRAYIDRANTASTTAARNDIIITGVIEAKHGRDVMINGVPNDFVQAPVPQMKGTRELSRRFCEYW